ncbi:MAG: anthranilate synthase component I [Phycisphaerales bacterium]
MLQRAAFRAMASTGNLVPIVRRLFSDQITPVLAYRRLVSADERTAPSFLFESVETGGRAGRWSLLGAQPSIELIAFGNDVTVVDRERGSTRRERVDDPLALPARIGAGWRLGNPDAVPSARGALPRCFRGGWVGYAGYDTVRFLEPRKLPFEAAPRDDRGLPDLHFGLYRQVVAIDHVDKLAYAIVHVPVDEHDSVDAAYDAGTAAIEALVGRLETHSVQLPSGVVGLDLAQRPAPPAESNITRSGFEDAVRRAQRYIAAGDAFQVVLSQRLSRTTTADPFDLYRALRIVNPSPYQIYLQARGSILVASSPEILCRVQQGVVTNRPLAGTRRRGSNAEEDVRLERELLADEKERAEHVMLVDLGRNDLGRVCETGSISIDRCMEVERYSHVMHISSTVTGRLRAELTCWDALRATLPVGTVSGAPKVRAMQIIDEIEPTRRGPYAGGIGCVAFDGDMDIALALRTIVVPTSAPFVDGDVDEPGPHRWTAHLQAGAGIVLDSVPSSEFEETMNKAAGLGRAIELAEGAFGAGPNGRSDGR